MRQFVISRVDPDAFAPQTSQFSMLENASGNPPQPPVIHLELPKVDPDTVDTLLSTFAVAVGLSPRIIIPTLTLTLTLADFWACRPH